MRFRGLKHRWVMAQTLTRLGSMACEAGKFSRASKVYGESPELVRQWGLSSYAAICLEGLARVATMQDRPERAARLCSAADTLRQEIRVSLSPTARAECNRIVTAARAALGEDAFAAAWVTGHALPLEGAIADALGSDE